MILPLQASGTASFYLTVQLKENVQQPTMFCHHRFEAACATFILEKLDGAKTYYNKVTGRKLLI